MSEIDDLLAVDPRASTLPFVDGTTDLNAATMNQLEIAARKGQANGYAGLDAGGKVPVGQIPNGVPAGGAAGQLLKKNSASDYDLIWGAAAAAGSGNELDYAQIIANPAAIATTTEATSGLIISGNPVTYDGTMAVLVHFWCPGVLSGQTPVFVFYRDATPIGQARMGAPGNVAAEGWYLSLRDVPPAGSHTYSIRAYTLVAGSMVVQAGPGGAGNYAPAFLRVVQSVAGIPAPQPPTSFMTGSVSLAGAVVAGSGYSVAKGAAGIYNITFNTPFANAPVVVPSPLSLNRVGYVTNLLPASVTITLANPSTLAAADTAFVFLATSIV